MNEEKIKTLEKKVDLLFRMHFEGDFNTKDNLHEFIPLFDLSIEMKRPEGLITEEELSEMSEEVREELDKLRSNYRNENISVKEHNKLPNMIAPLVEKQKALNKIEELYVILRRFEDSLRKELLMINLKEKLGIKLSEEYGFRHKESLENDVKKRCDDIQYWLNKFKENFELKGKL